MIILFTDFGANGPYVGQMEAVLKQHATHIPIIHLLHNAPPGDPLLSSYLLAALRHSFPVDSIFLAVVDPGVGGLRKAVVLKADGQYFVGPANNLLNTVALQSQQTQWWEITWFPETCSNSFHGRDLFAPVVASLAQGVATDMLTEIVPPDLSSWPADLHKIIYFDHFGNAMTGVRYQDALAGTQLNINEQLIDTADTFCSVPVGQPFYYKNSSGLIEIAVNQGRAESQLCLRLGQPFSIA